MLPFRRHRPEDVHERTQSESIQAWFRASRRHLGHHLCVFVGYFDWLFVVLAAAAVTLGSRLGAKVMPAHLPPRRLEQNFGVVLLFVTGNLILGLV